MLQRLAYLAPEIPSLSATFVYNEIFALQKKQVAITTISVHSPSLANPSQDLQKLRDQTRFLYHRSLLVLGLDNLVILLKKPGIYLQTLMLALQDIQEVGITKLSSFKLLYHFLQGSSVAKILMSDRCEHLHIHFAHVPTQIGMYAAALAEISFSFTSHANDLFENNLLLQQKIDRAKLAVTISYYNKAFLKKYTKQTDKIQIVRCGIDTEKYVFKIKESLQSKPILKSLARLVEKKGMDTLIKAVKFLQIREIELTVEIAGDGPLKDSLERLVTDNNLTNCITFKGAIANHLVFDWLQEADIFVLACKADSQGDSDGIPVVLMEAMAVGIPVISTRLSGIPELIEDGVSGYLAEPNDPNSLADTIEKAIAQSSEIANLTKKARQKIVEEFNIECSGEKLLNGLS